MKKYLALSLVAATILSASCRKNMVNKVPSAPTCIANLYGNTMPVSQMTNSYGNCQFGPIDQATGVFTSVGSFFSSVYTNQAAFNTSENCYYVFKTKLGDSKSPAPLYKISLTGVVLPLTTTSTANFSSLTYNRVIGKLYCIADGIITDLSITGNTFSALALAAPVHPFAGLASVPVPMTVDDNTGDLYYISGDNDNIYFEKYTIGSATPVTIASLSRVGFVELLGMRYNKNDNKLYAIRKNNNPSQGCDFVRIDPKTASVTTLATLSYQVNNGFYSACIDPCANRYILSTGIMTGANPVAILDQFGIDGTLLQHNTTPTLYQGLEVNQ